MHRHLTAAIVLNALVLSMPAFAGDPPAGAPPLGGPPVAKEAGQGEQPFGEKGPKGNGNKERPLAGMAAERRNLEFWRKAFEQVLPTLSPDVQDKVKAMRADFEQRTKAWREQNQAKITALEQQVREKQKEAKEEDGNKAARKPDPALLQEVQKLRATAPKAEELQQSVWALLTPEQQAAFKERYDAIKQQAEAKKEERKEAKKPADPMQADPMLPGGEKPGKKPNGKPFNFEDPGDDAGRKGDGKPSGK
jgi:hypothetical protein